MTIMEEVMQHIKITITRKINLKFLVQFRILKVNTEGIFSFLNKKCSCMYTLFINYTLMYTLTH